MRIVRLLVPSPALLLAALLLAPAAASAQWPQPAQQSPWPSAPQQQAPQSAWPSAQPQAARPMAPQPMSPQPMAPLGAPQAAPQASSICAQFPPLRAATEKAAQAIQAAGKRKAPPTEVCPLFRNFVAAEAKMIKFLADNKTACGVPDQAISGARANHAKVTEIRNKVCAVAAAPRQQAPSLADALSAPVATTTETVTTTRGGTFDTLTGSALAK